MPRWKALPDELDPQVKEFASQLRRLVDQGGLSIAAVADRTGYSKTSWERYLDGRLLAPKGAIVALAEATGTNPVHLATMWELAERAWSRSEMRHDLTMEASRISQARAALGEFGEVGTPSAADARNDKPRKGGSGTALRAGVAGPAGVFPRVPAQPDAAETTVLPPTDAAPKAPKPPAPATTDAAATTVLPATGAAETTVLPATAAAETAVLPATGAAETTVLPATGAAETTVLPSTGAAETTVLPATAAAETTVLPATDATDAKDPARPARPSWPSAASGPSGPSGAPQPADAEPESKPAVTDSAPNSWGLAGYKGPSPTSGRGLRTGAGTGTGVNGTTGGGVSGAGPAWPPTPNATAPRAANATAPRGPGTPAPRTPGSGTQTPWPPAPSYGGAGVQAPPPVVGPGGGAGKRRATMFLAGLVGVLVVIAGVFYLTDGGQDGTADAAASPSPSVRTDLPAGVKCAGADCTGKDAETMGCTADATTVTTAKSAVVGPVTVEVRYSSVCEAAWGRITQGSPGDKVEVTAGKTKESDALSVSGDTIAYTPMVHVKDAGEAVACATLAAGQRGCTP
ncbi:DUF2690 domain-containing protein [Streptomyces sp. NPDC091279]|uniref:helix-turn-helix domain-containing protein n=1 Tax=Streptomyces sp. NPDC091279 TaxID=3365983 RepID=UPI0038182FE6